MVLKTRMTPDLPVELWLHILALLPKRYLRNMMGINRILFELAMNEVYREIRFIEDGKDMARIFSQLKYPHISRRVQHLYIRPGFFSQMESDNPVQKKLPERSSRNRWKKYLCSSTEIPIESPPSKWPSFGTHGKDILAVAQDAIIYLHGVEELSIVLHDLLPPPQFSDFVGATWAGLGPGLCRLNIDATLAKLPLLLDPNMVRHLPRLTDLNIRFAGSRFPRVPQRGSLVPQILLPFITSLKGTLESLSISSAEILDLSPLLHGLGYFPHLRKLELLVVMNHLTFSDPAALTSFISLHKHNLQHLSMSAHHRAALNNPSDASYEAWITNELPQIEFTILESLQLGLYAEYPSTGTIIPRLPLTKLPNLVSVAFTDGYLSQEDMETFLGHAGGEIPWQTLQLNVGELTPQVIDTLAAKLPRLTELDLNCRYVSADPDTYQYASLSSHWLFSEEMFSRAYPRWGIRRLRIAVTSYDCGQPHADLNYMQSVARCLPTTVSFVMEDSCLCQIFVV